MPAGDEKGVGGHSKVIKDVVCKIADVCLAE